jgi:uncharacterized lipoprotein YajG
MNKFRITQKILLFAAIGIILTGCESTQRPIITTPPISKAEINIQQLASRLGMGVSETTSTYVTLKDSQNTVLLFTYYDGS